MQCSSTHRPSHSPTEENADGLTAQFAERSLIFRKSTVSVANHESLKTRSRDTSSGPSIVSNNLKSHGYVPSQCELNPNRDSECTHCGKMGHEEISCWTNKYSVINRVYVYIVQSMSGDENAKAREDKKSENVGLATE